MILEKDFLYRVPVKTAPITTPKGLIRNPEILVDIEGGEFMHGNILDANSTNKLINQSVKETVDNTKDLLDAETSARTNGDEDLNAKIKAELTRAEGKEKEISDKLAIFDGDSNTEGSFRKAIADVIADAPEDLDTLKEIADKLADSDDLHTALNQAITEKADASALANEVSRATSAESNLQSAIDAKLDAGNYIPYEKKYDDSLYDLEPFSGFRLRSGDDDSDNKVTIRHNGINVANITGELYTDISGSGVDVYYGSLKTQVTPTSISGYITNGNILKFKLYERGVLLNNGDDNHVLTSNAGTIDITLYAKKSEVTDQIATKADTTALTALEQKVDANTTAITNDIESLREIVKSLATELNTLGLIKLKSAEETA